MTNRYETQKHPTNENKFIVMDNEPYPGFRSQDFLLDALPKENVTNVTLAASTEAEYE